MWSDIEENLYSDKPYLIYDGIEIISHITKEDVIEKIENNVLKNCLDRLYVENMKTGMRCSFDVNEFLKMAESSEQKIKEIKEDKIRQNSMLKGKILPIAYDSKNNTFIAKKPKNGYVLNDIKKFENWHNSILIIAPIGYFLSRYIFNDVGGVILLCLIIYVYGLYWEILYRNNKRD